MADQAQILRVAQKLNKIIEETVKTEVNESKDKFIYWQQRCISAEAKVESLRAELSSLKQAIRSRRSFEDS